MIDDENLCGVRLAIEFPNQNLREVGNDGLRGGRDMGRDENREIGNDRYHMIYTIGAAKRQIAAAVPLMDDGASASAFSAKWTRPSGRSIGGAAWARR